MWIEAVVAGWGAGPDLFVEGDELWIGLAS